MAPTPGDGDQGERGKNAGGEVSQNQNEQLDLRLGVVLRIRKELRGRSLEGESCASSAFVLEELAKLLRRYGQVAQGSAKQRAEAYVRDVRKLPDGKVDVDDWTHHMLRHYCGKRTTRVMSQLSAVLELAAKQQRGILDDLHEALESAPPLRRGGRLAFASIIELYGRTVRPHCKLPSEEEDVPSELKAFARDDWAFAREISQALDLGDDTHVTYSDFLSCFLGRRRQEVQLNVYDLSKGRAQQLSRWLPIPEMDGLWHSGLVVFGWEYFYCGDVICALPGQTIFGVPSKHITLGHTLRQRAELHQYIVQEIKPAFTRDKYDTLNNNCNHFSDRLCGWLGCKHLPEEILQQHVKILEAPFAKAVWPMLNNMLGGSSVSSCNCSNLRVSSVLPDTEEVKITSDLGVTIDDRLSEVSADL